ncbi:MAG: hypothetical protein GF353_23110 [Candidatus Lokiarchaeota archaeon]|nr:hypothetical protein [Candidatus Lokiarchaeota archaeon]
MTKLKWYLLIVYFCFSFNLYPLILYSQSFDAAIICDISLSIKNRELASGKNVILKMFSDGTIPGDWQLAESSSRNTFPFLSQSSSPSIIGKNLLIMEFGTILYDKFPYFKKPNSVKPESRGEVVSFISNQFPERVSQDWTYEFLAEAVISKILREQFQSREWYLFVLSDFIESHGFSMTDEQTALVDDYLSGKKLKFSTPVILQYKNRKELQIKVVKVSISTADQRHTKIFSLLAPGNRFEYKNKKMINFSWKWKGNPEDINNYILVVRKKERKGYKIICQKRLTLNRYVLKTPSGGNYEWFVTANTKQGTMRSDIRKFKIAGASAAPFFISLFIIFAVAIAFFKFIWPKLQALKARRNKNEY